MNHFLFENPRRKLTISGWFDPQDRFPGVKKLWNDEQQNASSRGMPVPKDIMFKNIAGWETVIYDLPVGAESSCNLRAHRLQSGTWIELHISVLSKKESCVCRTELESVLSNIKVAKKGNG